MAQHYAWSDLKWSEPSEKGDAEIIQKKRGEKVSKSDFPGMSQAQYDAMVAGGSIRTKPFPAPNEYDGSAIDYLRDSLIEAQSGDQVEEEEAMGELAKVQEEASKLADTQPAQKEDEKKK